MVGMPGRDNVNGLVYYNDDDYHHHVDINYDLHDAWMVWLQRPNYYGADIHDNSYANNLQDAWPLLGLL